LDTVNAYLSVINFALDEDEETETTDNIFSEPINDEDRNNEIFELRNKQLSETKTGRDYYEKHAQYNYKTQKAKEQFLKEVEDKGLDRKDKHKPVFYDGLDVLYYRPNEKLGRDPVTKEDPDIFFSSKDLNKCQKEEKDEF